MSTQNPMPVERLREQLYRFEQTVAKHAQDSAARALRPSANAEWYAGRASGYRTALSFLHTWTDHEFGMTLDEAGDLDPELLDDRAVSF